jgi:hypothetical protein
VWNENADSPSSPILGSSPLSSSSFSYALGLYPFDEFDEAAAPLGALWLSEKKPEKVRMTKHRDANKTRRTKAAPRVRSEPLNRAVAMGAHDGDFGARDGAAL